MTDEVLDIMQPGNVVTDEQLAMIDSNADLREACQDVMMIKGILAEKADAEKALHKLQQRHRARRRNLYWAAGLAAAALFAGALFLLWPARHTTEESLLAQQAELAQQASASDMADEVVITSSDSLSQSVSRIVAEASSADTPSLPDEVVNVGGGTTASEQVVTSTLTVPYGHSVLVKLSDGTRVYLRPGSKLIYPETFVGDHRIVSLKGEAYFCVAHRPNQPFIVGTKHGIVSDYGTEFNIDTQADKTEVVLVEGSVGVKVYNEKEQLLRPGQKATLNASTSQHLSIEEADTDPYTAWRDGYFYFNEQTLGDIITQLACSYNLTIECHNTDLLRLRLRYIIPRTSTPAYAIEILNRLQSGHITLEGNRIVIR
jgi:ferric-dicitrate binding protein FerR (iron transport regulator)